MADYKQSSVTGTKWQRCREISLSNPYQGSAIITFGEEELIALPDSSTIRLSTDKYCSATFDPIAGTIVLLNPATGEPTGSSLSHLELYTILYSLYIATAQARDIRVAEQAAKDAANT